MSGKLPAAIGGTHIKVTQVGSPIGRPPYQEANLVALGLNKLHRSRVVTDTPENRGRITRVLHLLRVEVLPGATAPGETNAGGQASA